MSLNHGSLALVGSGGMVFLCYAGFKFGAIWFGKSLY